jgi:hypothetical protein
MKAGSLRPLLVAAVSHMALAGITSLAGCASR